MMKVYKKKEGIAIVCLLAALLCAYLSVHTQLVHRDTALASTVAIVIANAEHHSEAPLALRYVLSQSDAVLFEEVKHVDLLQETFETVPENARQRRVLLSHNFYISKGAKRGLYHITVFAKQPQEQEEQLVADTTLLVAPSVLPPEIFRILLYLLSVLALILFSVALRERFRERR